MGLTRRDFVKHSSAAVASVALTARGAHGLLPAVRQLGANSLDGQLCMFALDAARSAGAEYADVRVVRTRHQVVRTREERVSGLQDAESIGVGVRVLVDGSWGFASSHLLQRPECVRLAAQAVAQARANRVAGGKRVELAPVDAYPDGEWHSPIEIDPFDIPVDEKVALLLAANAEALSVGGVQFANSQIECMRIDTTFGSTAGSLIGQRVYRTYPAMTITALTADGSEYQSRSSTEVPPMGRGYEHVIAADLEGRAAEWGEQAVQKLTATPVQPGRYDLVLHPSNLFLTIHESIGHPTELDRALGYEASYAGTSFLSPPEAMIGTFRYGPEFMNVQADRTQRGALATVGWDDEGVPADSWPIVRDGVFVDYQTTREQAAWIAPLTGNDRSHGCAHAASWDRMPFQRMPNVSLLPGERHLTIDDLIAATDRGILIEGRGSYSIDQQRYNFQFGGQVFHEIRNGTVVGMLRDVAYEGRTPEFWNSLDMLGGPRSYELCGTLYDGKGQPSTSNAASHGCPPARFRNVSILNTNRTS